MNPAPALVAEAVDAGYGSVRVIRAINLSLEPRRVTVVLGPNGAGKTTLCKALAGAIPSSAGRILLHGQDIITKPAWWRFRHGVFLSPEGRGIFPSLTVDENLRLLIPDSRLRQNIYERFPALGQRQRVHAGHLSGGEQQMVTIAPALTEQFSVVIADEPTLGLAPRFAQLVLEALVDVSRQGAAVLITGESPRGLFDIADDIALQHTGQLTWCGSANEFDSQSILDTYLGTTGSAAS